MKANRGFENSLKILLSLLSTYKVDSFIAGCTEDHNDRQALKEWNIPHKTYDRIDPLQIRASQIADRVSAKADLDVGNHD